MNSVSDKFGEIVGFTEETVDTTPLPSLHTDPPFDFTDLELSSDQVCDALLGLDVLKAVGPDGIHPIFLKIRAPIISPSLTLIFNKSLKTGIFTDAWKLAFVTPVYKKGNKEDPSNYRPISLLSCISKILEGFVYTDN